MKRRLSVIYFLIFLLILTSCKIKNSASGGSNAQLPTVITGPDPLAPYQWYLANKGEAIFSASNGTANADINFDDLYTLGKKGKGIVVAVSDSNIDMDHEDLKDNANITLSRNYLNSSSTSWPGNRPISANNTSFHGTSVMGLIGALDQNALGIRGVSPRVTLAGMNFVESNQSLSRYIDQAKGPFDIFNYSYGSETCAISSVQPSFVAQLKYGVTSQRSNLGSIYVKSAGNSFLGDISSCINSTGAYIGNTNMEQANTYPYFILVAALKATGPHTDYSTPGSGIWISAPGGDDGVSAPGIVTTDLPGCSKGVSKTSSTGNSFDKGQNSLNKDCHYTAGLAGTSFSAPIVSGVVALMLEANPMLSWRDVKHILASTATHIDPTANNSAHPLGQDLSGHNYDYGWLQNSANFWFHNWYGFGRVNAKAAVTMAETYTSYLGTLLETKDLNGDWLFVSPTTSTTIPDNSSTGVSSTLNVTSTFLIEAVQVSVNINHNLTSDLGIEITSPSGMKSTILNINSGILDSSFTDAQFLTNAFYGESTLGNWSIKVVDGAAGDIGTFISWKINFIGHAP